MFRPSSLLLAVGLAASISGPVAGEVVNHRNYAVVVHDEVEILIWVSEEVFNASEPPEGFPAEWWPTVEQRRAGLKMFLSLRPTEDAACLPLPRTEPVLHGLPAATEAAPADYAAFLASSGLAVVGEVEAVEPGVMVFGEGGISPRVRVYLTEVLRDVEGAVSPGSELTYLGIGGRLRLDDRLVCALEASEQAMAERGARVILTAGPSSGSASFVNSSTVFRVHDGTVELPAGNRFKQRTIPLAELRLAASLAERRD